jgi:hypothetical protein
MGEDVLRQVKSLEAALHAGKITFAEFEERVNEIFASI